MFTMLFAAAMAAPTDAAADSAGKIAEPYQATVATIHDNGDDLALVTDTTRGAAPGGKEIDRTARIDGDEVTVTLGLFQEGLVETVQAKDHGKVGLGKALDKLHTDADGIVLASYYDDDYASNVAATITKEGGEVEIVQVAWARDFQQVKGDQIGVVVGDKYGYAGKDEVCSAICTGTTFAFAADAVATELPAGAKLATIVKDGVEHLAYQVGQDFIAVKAGSNGETILEPRKVKEQGVYVFAALDPITGDRTELLTTVKIIDKAKGQIEVKTGLTEDQVFEPQAVAALELPDGDEVDKQT